MKIAAGDVSNIPQDSLAEEAIMQRPWILASARVHQNIEWVKSWVENENPDEAVAFDFELMNAKRIAQLRHGQKGHQPVQNK